MPTTAALQLARRLAAEPPRATGFIVTLYGDVVLPRGGVLSMAALIETCAAQGISESLVRTAVSRLVGAGQLAGERIGRRSFYRLTDGAAAEYAGAARLFYAPPRLPDGFTLALGTLPEPLPASWARIGPEAALAPEGGAPRLAGVATLAVASRQAAGLPGFAAAHWPLAEVAERYRTLLATFPAGFAAGCEGPAALALRLRLIHLYRLAALRDPRLPRAALPEDWPGFPARRRFVALYRALSAAADRHVGVALDDSRGPLPAETPETRRRMAALAAEASGQDVVSKDRNEMSREA